MCAQDKESTQPQGWLFASQTSMLQVTPLYRAEMVEGAGARPGRVVAMASGTCNTCTCSRKVSKWRLVKRFFCTPASIKQLPNIYASNFCRFFCLFFYRAVGVRVTRGGWVDNEIRCSDLPSFAPESRAVLFSRTGHPKSFTPSQYRSLDPLSCFPGIKPVAKP